MVSGQISSSIFEKGGVFDIRDEIAGIKKAAGNTGRLIVIIILQQLPLPEVLPPQRERPFPEP